MIIDDFCYYHKNEFLYKDMDETSFPYYFNCPQTILTLLTPSTDEQANRWRKYCKDYKQFKKLGKTVGVTIKLARQAKFGDGTVEDVFKVERYGKRGFAYRSTNGKLYSLQNETLINCEQI